MYIKVRSEGTPIHSGEDDEGRYINERKMLTALDS